MPGQPPKYRLFISDETGKMPTDDNDHWIELAALWQTRKPDKNGNEMYSGRTGRGEQYLMLVENVPKQRADAPVVAAPTTTPATNDDDVPF